MTPKSGTLTRGLLHGRLAAKPAVNRSTSSASRVASGSSAMNRASGCLRSETPEGHAVRLDDDGRITHLTAINARWLLNRDGEVVAILRDGRQLRLARDDLADIVP
jgi:methyl coenzyme M reductase gamma subunit